MRILIIGGAGFIGVNSAIRFREAGYEVAIIDNLSRVGSDYNINSVLAPYDCEFCNADIRDFEALTEVIGDLAPIDCVLLLAGQVAVTTSVENPREDFEINAFGTLNVLEALRERHLTPLVLYSSTNKVYGKMDDVKVAFDGTRYAYAEKPFGINESQRLGFSIRPMVVPRGVPNNTCGTIPNLRDSVRCISPVVHLRRTSIWH